MALCYSVLKLSWKFVSHSTGTSQDIYRLFLGAQTIQPPVLAVQFTSWAHQAAPFFILWNSSLFHPISFYIPCFNDLYFQSCCSIMLLFVSLRVPLRYFNSFLISTSVRVSKQPLGSVQRHRQANLQTGLVVRLNKFVLFCLMEDSQFQYFLSCTSSRMQDKIEFLIKLPAFGLFSVCSAIGCAYQSPSAVRFLARKLWLFPVDYHHYYYYYYFIRAQTWHSGQP